MLVQAKLAKNREEARRMLEEVVENGQAFDKFVAMVEAQGGDVSYILHPELFEESKHVIELRSKKSGYIKAINALNIGENAMRLGAGRATIEDVIDMSAGIVLAHKIGDQVKKGDLLATVYTNKDRDEYDPIILDLYEAYEIVHEEVKAEPVIREIID